MQLTDLTAKNFKRLEDHTFQFTPGMNFILGENGAGKSTLLRAIATAMFGVQMIPGVADDIPTRGQTTWSLELGFTDSGDVYRIKRTKSSAHLHKNGEPVASGNTPVTKYMEDLLGISAKDYNLLIHSRQGETAYVINYGTTALQRKVEEFAGAEVVEQIAKAAGDRSRMSSAQASGMTVLSAEQVRGLQQRERELTHEIDVEVRDYDESHLVAPTPPEQTVESLTEKVNKWDRWKREVEISEANVRRWQEELDSLPQPEPVEDSEQLEAELDDLHKQAKAQSEYNRVQQRTANLIEQKKEALAKLVREKPEKVEVDLASLEEVMKTSAARVMESETKIKSIRKQLEKGVCPTCGSENIDNVGELEIVLEHLELGHISLREAAWEAEELYQQAAKAEAEYSTALARFMEEQLEKTNLTKELEELEGSLQELIDLQPLQDLIYSKEVKLRTLEATKKANKRLETQREQLQHSIDEEIIAPEPTDVPTQEDVDKLQQQWQDYYSLNAAYNSQVEQRETKRKLIESLKGQHQQVVQTLTNNETVSKEVAQLQQDSELSASLSKFLRERRGDYLGQVWDSVLHYATEFLNTATSGWMTEVKIDDGKFSFRENGGWVPAIEASGAQEAFLGSALRVGLNKALYRGKAFMVFDEPTDGMREENARNLVAELGNCAGQTLIITHRESDQGLADNIIGV